MKCPGCADELRPDCLHGGVYIHLCFGCMTWWEHDPGTGKLFCAGDLVRRDHPGLHCDLCGKPVPRKSAWVECPSCVASEEDGKPAEHNLRREDCLSWRHCVNKYFGLVDCRGCEGFEEWKSWML